MFGEYQFDVSYPDGIENHYWQLARNSIIKHELLNLGIKQLNILEVGCGRGLVVEYLRSKGFNCWGVELADTLPRKNSAHYIQTGTSAQYLEETERDNFNLILLLDVIEHIKNPEDFLKELIFYFRNVDYILITVPARQELWSNYDEFVGHFRRYNLKIIEKYSHILNWKLVKLSYFFRITYFPALLMSLLKIKRKHEMVPPRGLVKKIVHMIIKNITIIEYISFPKKILGTSIICIISKK